MFSLSREEFMHIFFDDLELPNLARTELGHTTRRKSVRAGFTTTGAPANLSVVRTLTNSLARRIALRAGIEREQARLDHDFRAAIAVGEAGVAARVDGELDRLQRRRGALPFLEDLDLRYRNRVLRPEPIARAAMFCLMDVSASMDEDKKDLAKRFFTLLYLFLTRKYEEVELVFIRHTDDAEEVDEDAFFHDTRSGGTVVYSALELADKIRAERYASGWNVYAAQASDGDAFGVRPGAQRPLPAREASAGDALLRLPRAVRCRWLGAPLEPVGRVRPCCRGRRQLRHAPRRAPGADLPGVPRALPQGEAAMTPRFPYRGPAAGVAGAQEGQP